MSLSLRYEGQEVATVTVGDEPTLRVSKKQAARNLNYFGIDNPPGTFAWNGKDAATFRKAFKKAIGGKAPKSEERKVEARILKQLEVRVGATKFAGTLRNVRHCGLTKHEYPLQIPVPISANTGLPKSSRGNIDILARRGGPRRLSVWELKRPGAFADALAQAYIYAVTLVLMLRGKQGDVWYRNFCFNQPVPAKLHIEAVAVVTADQAGKLAKARAELAACPLDLIAESARISLHVAYYDPKDLKIRWVELGPR